MNHRERLSRVHSEETWRVYRDRPPFQFLGKLMPTLSILGRLD